MHALNARAWVDVDLGALLQNGAAYAARAGVPLMPMVKADAYGLGAVPVARALERLDPWGFGVATVDEGEELRAAGVTRPIVVFTPLLVDDLGAAERARLTPSLGARETILAWRATGLPWQLAIDTGMSRAGIQWNELDSIVDLRRRFSAGRCLHPFSLGRPRGRITRDAGGSIRARDRDAARATADAARGKQLGGRAAREVPVDASRGRGSFSMA